MTGNPWYRLDTFRAALRLVSMLPRDVAQEIAGAIGRAGYRIRPRRARGRPREPGPHHRPARPDARRDVPRKFRPLPPDALGLLLLLARSRGKNPRRWSRSGSGFEHIAAARERGKGGILITGHLGNWELGGILLALEGVPLTVVTLEEPASGLTQWREAYRRRLGIKTVSVGADPFSFVGIISALRRNEFVAMLVDRPYGALRRPGAVSLAPRPTSPPPPRSSGSTPGRMSSPHLFYKSRGAATFPCSRRPCPWTRMARPMRSGSRRFLRPLSAAIPNNGLTTSPSGNEPMSSRRLARRLLCAALLCLIAPVGPPSPPGNSTPAERAALLQQLRDVHAKQPGFEASFTEERTSHLLNKPVTSEGSVCFSVPDKFRREVRTPSPSTTVSDGHTMWIYYPSFNEVEIYTLGAALVLRRIPRRPDRRPQFRAHRRILQLPRLPRPLRRLPAGIDPEKAVATARGPATHPLSSTTTSCPSARRSPSRRATISRPYTTTPVAQPWPRPCSNSPPRPAPTSPARWGNRGGGGLGKRV